MTRDADIFDAACRVAAARRGRVEVEIDPSPDGPIYLVRITGYHAEPIVGAGSTAAAAVADALVAGVQREGLP